MVAPVIGDAGAERVHRMAGRRWGVLVPEVAEAFDVSYVTAWRFVQKLVREGLIKRTEERRRRTEVFESVRGKGAVVYRARRHKLEKQEWVNSRDWRTRGPSRARSR